MFCIQKDIELHLIMYNFNSKFTRYIENYCQIEIFDLDILQLKFCLETVK